MLIAQNCPQPLLIEDREIWKAFYRGSVKLIHVLSMSYLQANIREVKRFVWVHCISAYVEDNFEGVTLAGIIYR